MLLSSLNTGSTDLRDTEVQQPKTAATLFTAISSRAFSAKSGQSEAGSTTTASSFLPSRPPFLFCSSMSISMTSLSVVSEIAMVPDSECSTPTLIVSALCAHAPLTPPNPATNATPAAAFAKPLRVNDMPGPSMVCCHSNRGRSSQVTCHFRCSAKRIC